MEEILPRRDPPGQMQAPAGETPDGKGPAPGLSGGNGRPDAEAERLREALVAMAVESWRFRGVVLKALNKLDAGEISRYQSRILWHEKRLGEALELAGLKIVNTEGCGYDPGMAASPLNIGEFGEDDFLIVESMLEPIIMDSRGVVRTGTVTLRRDGGQ